MKVVVVRASWTHCEPLCPQWISAEGDITAGTPGQFAKILKQIGKQKLPVIIRSPGGHVYAALEIGRMIRKAGLPVIVGSTSFIGCAPDVKTCTLPKEQEGVYRGLPLAQNGYCASACPLILAGGATRLAGTGSVVGVHEIRTTWTKEHLRYLETYRIVNGRKKVISRKVVSRKQTSYNTFGIDKGMRKKLFSYLDEMGVSREMVDDMSKTPFASLTQLLPWHMKELKLVTTDNSEEFALGAEACRKNPVPGNCIASTVPMPPTAPGDEMIVARVRATGACEPLCPEWIAADGIITKETPALFKAVLDAAGSEKLPVIINSMRGDLNAALDIGRMIRAKGVDTAVGVTKFNGCEPGDVSCSSKHTAAMAFEGQLHGWGNCGQECLFVLAGGERRYPAFLKSSVFLPATLLVASQKGRRAADLAKSYLREMSLMVEWLDAARVGKAEGPATLDLEQLMAAGFGNRRTSPAFLADPSSCKGMIPLPNCVTRARPQLPAPAKDEMTVVRMRDKGACGEFCAEWIAAEGSITTATPERFRRVLEEAGTAKLPIVLQSHGGDAEAAIAIGRMIRARGLTTVIASIQAVGCTPRDPVYNSGRPPEKPYSGFVFSPGGCDNACLLVLAGGSSRIGYWVRYAMLAADQGSTSGQPTSGSTRAVTNYLAEMGPSQDLIIATRSERTMLLQQNDMLLMGLSTGREGPDDVISVAVCRAAAPPSNCIRRDKTS